MGVWLRAGNDTYEFGKIGVDHSAPCSSLDIAGEARLWLRSSQVTVAPISPCGDVGLSLSCSPSEYDPIDHRTEEVGKIQAYASPFAPPYYGFRPLALQPYGGKVAIGKQWPAAELDILSRLITEDPVRIEVSSGDGNDQASSIAFKGNGIDFGSIGGRLEYGAFDAQTQKWNVATAALRLEVGGKRQGVPYVASKNHGVSAEDQGVSLFSSGIKRFSLKKGGAFSSVSTKLNMILNNAESDVEASYGSWNTAVGYNTMLDNTGGSNTAVGAQALWKCGSGGSNTAVGESALTWLSTGSSNIGVGFNGGIFIYSGNYNFAAGRNTLRGGASLSHSVALGAFALYSVQLVSPKDLITGKRYIINWKGSADWTQVGAASSDYGVVFTATGPLTTWTGTNAWASMLDDTTCDANIAIGNYAGYNQASGGNNISIGFRANLPDKTASNQLNIGNIIFAKNRDLVPDQALSPVSGGGLVGIGTVSPIAKLDVDGRVVFVADRATEDAALVKTDQVYFKALSDTQLRVSLRGSDGVVRSATLVLS